MQSPPDTEPSPPPGCPVCGDPYCRSSSHREQASIALYGFEGAAVGVPSPYVAPPVQGPPCARCSGSGYVRRGECTREFLCPGCLGTGSAVRVAVVDGKAVRLPSLGEAVTRGPVVSTRAAETPDPESCGRCNGNGEVSSGRHRYACPVCRGSGLSLAGEAAFRREVRS